MCKRIFANQTSEMGEIPFYKIGTLGAIPNAYISRELFEVYKHKYHFPKIGEILISCSGTIGRCIQYDGKDAYFQDSNIVWIANDQSVIINDFLFYLIVRYDWNFLNTSTIKRLFTYDLCNLTIYYPKNKFEQKHIADTIKSIISKIENIEQKIKTLKKYKEGLVLKALKPTIENWKQGSVCGIRLSSFLVPYKKLATSKHHIHATLSKEGISGKTERYNRDFLVKDDNKKYRLTDKGDLVYNPANLKFGVICINNYGTCVVSPIYETFKVKNIDSDLLETIVTSKTFIRYALKFEEGTVYERRAVSVADLLSIKICVDDNNLFNISNTLRIIQEKIAILNHIKEQYCNFKTYLLNGMFI